VSRKGHHGGGGHARSRVITVSHPPLGQRADSLVGNNKEPLPPGTQVVIAGKAGLALRYIRDKKLPLRGVQLDVDGVARRATLCEVHTSRLPVLDARDTAANGGEHTQRRRGRSCSATKGRK
jgi:hypothetical protein